MIGQVEAVGDRVERVVFRVDGIPRGKGSMSTFMNPRTRRVQVRGDNPLTATWQEAVAQVARFTMGAHLPIDDAVEVFLFFRIVRPKGHWTDTGKVGSLWRDYPDRRSGGQTVTYDVDKLERAILDAMTCGGVYIDDSRVCDVVKKTRYAIPGQTLPGVDVEVVRLPPLEESLRLPRPRGGTVIRRRPGG